MVVLTSETCREVNNEIIKQVTSSWSLFIQLFPPLVHCLSQCDAVPRHQPARTVDNARCSAHTKPIMVCTFYLQSTLAAGSNTVLVINEITFLEWGISSCGRCASSLTSLPLHTRANRDQVINIQRYINTTKLYCVYYCIRSTCFDFYRIIFRPF